MPMPTCPLLSTEIAGKIPLEALTWKGLRRELLPVVMFKRIPVPVLELPSVMVKRSFEPVELPKVKLVLKLPMARLRFLVGFCKSE